MNAALARCLRDARQLQVLQQTSNYDGRLDGLLDALAFRRIEVEDEPVGLVEMLAAR